MDPVFVHERVFVAPDASEKIERVVDCPDAGAVPLARCERCPRFFQVSRDDRYGGEVVDCASAPLTAASAVSRHVDRGATNVDVVTTVSELMSRAYVAMAPGVPVHVARRYLVEEQIGCVLVLDGERAPIGIVTLRDFVEKRTEATKTVGDLATSPVVAVSGSLPIARAAAMMAFEGVHHLAIVDVEGAASGVLSSLDVLRWIGHRAGMLIPRATARQRARSFTTGLRSAR